ncbi:MAG: histidine kinase dimerization/phospho-acceptor domain-containing protein, partial [Chloroflexota bacterium]
MRQLSAPLKIYVGSVMALGSGMFALSLLAQPLDFTARGLALTVAFAILIALAGAYPVPLSSKVKVNVVSAPLFAAVLLLHPALAALAAIVGVIASEAALRRPWLYLVFNTATASLYTAAAGLALWTLGPEPGAFFSTARGVSGATLAAIMIFAVNRAAVAGAAALETGKSPLWRWKPDWRADVAQELALLSVGFGGAVATFVAPWALLLFVIPVVIVQRAFSRVVTLSARLEQQMEQLKAAEAQLVQSAKMASLGTLVASIGHQVNNPIFAIRGRAELLLEGADKHLKTEKARQHVEVIRGMADRIARVVRCLLTPSRPSEDGVACTDVNDALEHAVTLLDSRISASRVRVTREYDERLPLVPGDAVEIQEMLGNLLLNSCEAMPDGGELRLATRTVDSSVIVEVADTGVGIPEDNLAR